MVLVKYIFDGFYRFSGSNNNPKFIIPYSGISAKSFYVNKVIIPHSFYNINNVNNKIHWTDSLGVELTSTVTPGDYTISEFITALGNAMTASATDGLTYSVTKNDNTKKITITNSGPTNFDIRYDTTQTAPSVFFAMLGFYELYNNQQFYGDYNRIALLTGQSSYTANYSYWLSIRNIYLKSSLARTSREYESYAFVNNVHPTSYLTDTGINDILTTIPVTSNPGDLIVKEPYFEPEKVILNDKAAYGINDISFELVSDESYGQVDLNGRSFIVEIVFDV